MNRAGDASAGLSARLADFAARLEAAALPEDVRRVAKESLLDQVGTILAAAGLSDASAPFITLARSGGSGPASVLGHGFSAPPVMAALANGAMAHAVDFEDTDDDTLIHPNAPVVPAALAVAQAEGASGADFIAAIVAGAETSCRIARGFVGNPEKPNGFLVLPLIGAFGAAVAAGRVLGLNAKAMEQAMAIAMTQVVAPRVVMEHGMSDYRVVRDGFTAKAGVIAAYLARDGLNVLPGPLDGPGGYFGLFGAGQANEARALADLSQYFHAARVSFKPWPACRGAHSFIEAALTLRAAHHITPDQVAGIDIKISPFFETLCMPETERKRPSSPSSAKFSVPFAIGVALAQGEVTLADYTDAALTTPEVLRLADMVRHRVMPDQPYGQSTQGTVRLQLTDGRRVEWKVTNPTGHPSAPMGHGRLLDKFLDCASHAPTRPSRDRLLDCADKIENLEDQDSLSWLVL